MNKLTYEVDLDVEIINIVGEGIVKGGGRLLTTYKHIDSKLPCPLYTTVELLGKWFMVTQYTKTGSSVVIKPRLKGREKPKITERIDDCVIYNKPWKNIESIEEVMD